LLGQLTVQKCFLNVELVDRTPSRCRQVEHVADGAWFDDRGEGLIEVKPLSLREATHNSSCLAAFHLVGVELILEESLAGDDDVDTAWSGYECPRAVVVYSSELFLCSLVANPAHVR
jgi:hypothetical protein